MHTIGAHTNSNNGALPVFFRIGEYDAACVLVTKYHYSHRVPANVQCVGTWHAPGGLWGDCGDVVAACFFSIPPSRWKEPVWELSRLVRSKDASVPQLSGLIAATCRFIARAHSINLLVSFADVAHGHHGGVYQSASWRYHGVRKRSIDGVMINGAFYPGRSCNSAWGTSSATLLTRILGRDVEPHYDIGKHLYWRALTRAGAKKADRLGLASIAYPKPALGM